MVDRFIAWLRTLPQKFMNWWEQFTLRQKLTIGGITIAVIVAIVILVSVLSKPDYVIIYTASNAVEANSVIDLLEENNFEYQLSEDGLVISIKESDYTQVNLLLGSNEIYANSFGIDNVTDGGFTTTEADKQKRYIVYLETLMKNSLESYDFVKTATVQLNVPEDNGTLIAQNKESSASVLLELSGECNTDMAAAMARFVATALGNDTTEHVTILSTTGSLLYSGVDDNSTLGNASSTYALQEQVSNAIKNKVINALLATNEFSTIEVAPNIVLDTSSSQYTERLYWPDGDREEGVLASKDIYASESSGGVTGVPGTDSNTETTYQYEDNEYSNASVIEESYDYLPNESTLIQEIPAGAIKYDESSITVTLLTYDMIREQDIKQQGLLDGITWEEYKLNNSERTRVDVDDVLYQAVSTATGIATDRITIIAYHEPFFIDREGLDIETADVLQIILILLILGLLAFVIARSLKSSHAEEEEPEISIDDILKSTPVEELEEIGIEDKSEARKIVEKFVEDNPEAAANLLRNWLSEDWS
ncbi:MAG: flagellar M-ring protein FliF C-terminal domain-containing protein [Lachnospiraceae bacterium]